MAIRFDKPEPLLGELFAYRGLGYLLGCIISAVALEYNTSFSKPRALSGCLVAFSLTVLGMSTVASFSGMLGCIFVNGVCMGGFDTIGNVLMTELWRQRVQPWMLAMHATFGLGAIIGPYLVGTFGFTTTMHLVAIGSAFPCVFMLLLPLVSQWCVPAAGTKRKTQEYELVCGTETEIEIETEIGTVNSDMADTDGDANAVVDSGTDEEAGSAVDSDSAGSTIERICPTSVKVMLSLYFALCVGAEMGYSGWISTLALSAGITQSHAQASYLVSVFYAAFTVSRCTSVVISVYVANTYMIRTQMLISVVGCILAIYFDTVSYEWAAVATAAMGLGISTLFPLGLSMVQDYGYTMDARSTTVCILGATVGEVSLPLVIGRVMQLMGANIMPQAVFVLILSIIAIYSCIHHVLSTAGDDNSSGDDCSCSTNINNDTVVNIDA